MVVDRDHVAAVALVRGDDDAAVGGGADRGAGGRGDIDARVQDRPAVHRVHAHAEGRGDRARHGPCERARRAGFGRQRFAGELGGAACGGAARFFLALFLAR